jgi:hypothetical protein
LKFENEEEKEEVEEKTEGDEKDMPRSPSATPHGQSTHFT